MNKFIYLLYAPEDISGSVGGTREPMNAEDDLKFLREGNDDSKDEEETKDEEDVQDDSEEHQEDDETSDEETGPEDEDKDSDEDTEEIKGGLVTAKDLKKIDPDIFKKLPQLKGVIYREQQYSQIFGDPKEAQAAAVAAETFKEMESDLLSGNSQPLFEALKKGSDFNKFVSNLIPTLKKVDEGAYEKLMLVPIKQVLRSAFKTGEAKGDKNLALAAQHLHNYVFDDLDLNGKAEFEGDSTSKKSPEQEAFEKKTQELEARDHKTFKVSVDNQFVSSIKEAFLDKLDPDNVLSDWTKNKMFEEAVSQINEQMVADVRHMKNVELLWKSAKASGYNEASKSRIVNAALARAKQLIPEIRSKIRSEALAERRRVQGSKEQKKTVFTGRKITPQQKEKKSSTRDTSQMSDLDIIRS